MKIIFAWIKRHRIKHRLNQACKFITANCLERIRQGQLSGVSESAIGDWEEIQLALNDIYDISMKSSFSASSQLRSGDRRHFPNTPSLRQ